MGGWGQITKENRRDYKTTRRDQNWREKKNRRNLGGGRKKFRRHLGVAEIFLFFFGNQFLMNGIHSQGT